MKQNIYNDPVFFESYKELRENDTGLNEEIEIPAFRKLIDNIENSTVLDLGCGFGSQLQFLLDQKAKEVIGVDISGRMINEAKKGIRSGKIKLICTAIEDYRIEPGKFDIVLSSMTFHYIKDLDPVLENVYNGLKTGGQFIFSIEHPVCTALLEDWVETEKGKIWSVARYSQEGIRYQNWFVPGVKKYHRKISTLIDSLIATGFKICSVEEPEPPRNILKKRPDLSGHMERPPILIIKSEK